MAVEANLHPGRQRIEVALTTHRAALPHRQLLVAALDARGTGIGRGTQRPVPGRCPPVGVARSGLGECPRRRVMPRRACPVGISFEHGRDV